MRTFIIVVGSRRTSKLTSLSRSPGRAVSWPSTPMSTAKRLRSGASRSTAVCKKHGVPINSTCRQLAVSLLYGPILCRNGQARLWRTCVQKSDFTRFDYIIGMVCPSFASAPSADSTDPSRSNRTRWCNCSLPARVQYERKLMNRRAA